jgi:glycosyltransferase involved in cell wall biosynthesis
MRLLHAITSLARGGAEHHLLSLAVGQASAGHSVAVVGLKEPSDLAPAFAAAGVEAHCLGLARYGEIAPALRLRQLIRTFRPELLHAHLPPAELYARLALAGSRLPLVITRHNDERFAPIVFERALSRWCAGRAARVICISEAVRRWNTQDPRGPGIGAARCAVVRYALDAAPFERAAPAPDLVGEGPLVGTLARLVPQKGLDVLLEAFAHIPPPARLVIAGDGPLRQALLDRAARPDLAGRVAFLGARADSAAVLAALDLFVLPSRWEGFGLVLLEAMAAGRAIVATRVSAIPEVVAEGETALLVPPDDAPALAAAIGSLLQNSARRAAKGAAGHARVCAHFRVPAMVSATLEIYREALAWG